MAYTGYIDVVRANLVAGWVYDSRQPNEALEVEVLLGDKPPILAKADLLRDDLLQSGLGNGRHGFEVAVDGASNPNQVRVRIRGSQYYLQNALGRVTRIQAERFNNSIIDGVPSLPWGFSQREPGPADERVAAEIVAAARALARGGRNAPRKSDLWDNLVSNEHAGLLSLIQAGDARALAAFLCSLPKQRPGEGVLQGERAYRDIFAAADSGKNWAALPTHDQLVALAQYLGVVRMETTEQGEYGSAIRLDPAKVLQDIEREIGVSALSPDVFSDLFGLKLGGGLVEQRGLQGLYAGLRMKSIIGLSRPRADAFGEPRPARVCEIGGGFGLAAAFSWRLGFGHFTIVDLPSMLLMQYYFLRMALPQVKVAFVYDDEPIPQEPGVYLVTAAGFAKPRAERFDLALNVDSFPEMGEDVCANYFDLIAERSPLLLSINQEANGPLTNNIRGPRQPAVSQLMAKRRDYTRVYRFRTWLRKGYVEELYRVA